MFKLNQIAIEAYDYGVSKGIINETMDWIIDIVQDQEIVSFSTCNGTISFDVFDLVESE